MITKIKAPIILDNPNEQRYLEYLRAELDDILEKTGYNTRSKRVLKASERLNMFINIYIRDDEE